MKWYLLLGVLVALSSCTDEEQDITSSEDCVWKDEMVRVFDKNKETPCIYTDVYELHDELFTICHCCVCGKVEAVISCDGTNICIDVNGCTSSFLDEAEYQYSFE